MICRYCNGTGTSNTCVNGTFKPCAACNGTGEEIKEKITNFNRITASPEALAEFIYQAFYQYDGRYNSFQQDIEDEYCYERNHYEYGDREQVILDWLNEEYKNE